MEKFKFASAMYAAAVLGAVAIPLTFSAPAFAEEGDESVKCETFMNATACAVFERLSALNKSIPAIEKQPERADSAASGSAPYDSGGPKFSSDGTEEKAERDWVTHQAQLQIAEREEGYRQKLAAILVLDRSTLTRLNQNCTDNAKPNGPCMNDVADAKHVLVQTLALLGNKEAAAYVAKAKPGWQPESPDRAAQVKMPVPGYEMTGAPKPVGAPAASSQQAPGGCNYSMKDKNTVTAACSQTNIVWPGVQTIRPQGKTLPLDAQGRGCVSVTIAGETVREYWPHGAPRGTKFAAGALTDDAQRSWYLAQNNCNRTVYLVYPDGSHASQALAPNSMTWNTLKDGEQMKFTISEHDK